MAKAARLSFAELTSLIERMPHYNNYRTLDDAAAAERTFRRALGGMIKECGDRLLTVAENRGQFLAGEQREMIDVLVDRIAAILRRLDREGIVCLVGDCETTIAELEEIDTRLILLVEESLTLVHHLNCGLPSARWFRHEATLLSRDLAAFSEAAEERNYLLGLGWESEFTWRGRGTSWLR
jgi:hypothetical protein